MLMALVSRWVQADNDVGNHEHRDKHESDALHELLSVNPLVINQSLNGLLRIKVHVVFLKKILRQLEMRQCEFFLTPLEMASDFLSDNSD